MKKNLGWLLFIILSLLPVIFWISSKPIHTRFANPIAILTSFGQIAGLLGMTTLTLTIILGSRLKLLEEYFGGLNKVYAAHHILGSVAFILLLFHPLMLATRFLRISIVKGVLFLLPSDDWSINFGIMALLFLIILLFLTFLGNLSYQKWKFSHGFLGIVFILATLHSLSIPSDISQNPILRIYMVFLFLIDASALTYHIIKTKFSFGYFKYLVKKTTILGEDIMEITLSPKTRKIDFIPGQFIFVRFIGKDIPLESHPFSITSSIFENDLRLVIKTLGDYTLQLKNLKPDTPAEIEGPFGNFSYQNSKSKNQIWLAGGIGITPFLSMIRSIRDDEYKIDLYYCLKNRKEAVFLEELLKISKDRPNFRVIPFYSEEKGWIDEKFVEKTSGDLGKRSIFLCGPPKMVESLKEKFLKMGVATTNIHSEEFNFR